MEDVVCEVSLDVFRRRIETPEGDLIVSSRLDANALYHRLNDWSGKDLQLRRRVGEYVTERNLGFSSIKVSSPSANHVIL